MNSYMLLMTDGTSEEVEAEFYHVDGEDLVFMAGQVEVHRVRAAELLSITKAR